MFFTKKDDKEIEYKDPLNVLENYMDSFNSKEVLYTLGKEQIIKEDNKYYISDTFDNSKIKELSKDAAYEMISDIKLGNRLNNRTGMYLD